MKSVLVSVVAFAFLAAFVVVWLWIAYDLQEFEATDLEPVLDLEDKVVQVAGFLAATVAAGTAAFLGIEVQQRRGEGFRTWVTTHFLRAVLLAAGVLAYLFVGSVVFYLWLTEPEPTPDFVATFAWGALGWAAGAFTAAFAASEP